VLVIQFLLHNAHAVHVGSWTACWWRLRGGLTARTSWRRYPSTWSTPFGAWVAWPWAARSAWLTSSTGSFDIPVRFNSLIFRKGKNMKKNVHSTYRVKYNISFTTPDLQSVFIDIHTHTHHFCRWGWKEDSVCFEAEDMIGKLTSSDRAIFNIGELPHRARWLTSSTSVSDAINVGLWRHLFGEETSSTSLVRYWPRYVTSSPFVSNIIVFNNYICEKICVHHLFFYSTNLIKVRFIGNLT